MGGVEGSACKELLNRACTLSLLFTRYALFEDHSTKPRVWFSGRGNILVCGVASMRCFEITNFRSLMIFEDALLVYDVEILNNCCSESFQPRVIT